MEEEQFTERFLHPQKRAASKLEKIQNAIREIQIADEGIDYSEPLWVDRAELVNMIDKLAEKCKADINVVRFLQLNEKDGFIRAVILVLETENRK